MPGELGLAPVAVPTQDTAWPRLGPGAAAGNSPLQPIHHHKAKRLASASRFPPAVPQDAMQSSLMHLDSFTGMRKCFQVSHKVPLRSQSHSIFSALINNAFPSHPGGSRALRGWGGGGTPGTRPPLWGAELHRDRAAGGGKPRFPTPAASLHPWVNPGGGDAPAQLSPQSGRGRKCGGKQERKLPPHLPGHRVGHRPQTDTESGRQRWAMLSGAGHAGGTVSLQVQGHSLQH